MPKKDFFDRLIKCINTAGFLAPLTIALILIVYITADNAYYNNNSDRLVKEMPQSSRDKVFNSGDSTLNSQTTHYDKLIKDYNSLVHDMRCTTGVLRFRSAEFEKHYIESDFANQIGVKNLKEYKRYIKKYETDSIEPRMRYVYNNSVKKR